MRETIFGAIALGIIAAAIAAGVYLTQHKTFEKSKASYDFTITATPACNGSQPVINLSWPTFNPDDTPSVNVYRNPPNTFINDQPFAGASGYTDANVIAGSTYAYTVYAGNDNGSSTSNTVYGTASSDCGGPPPGPSCSGDESCQRQLNCSNGQYTTCQASGTCTPCTCIPSTCDAFCRVTGQDSGACRQSDQACICTAPITPPTPACGTSCTNSTNCQGATGQGEVASCNECGGSSPPYTCLPPNDYAPINFGGDPSQTNICTIGIVGGVHDLDNTNKPVQLDVYHLAPNETGFGTYIGYTTGTPTFTFTEGNVFSDQKARWGQAGTYKVYAKDIDNAGNNVTDTDPRFKGIPLLQSYPLATSCTPPVIPCSASNRCGTPPACTPKDKCQRGTNKNQEVACGADINDPAVCPLVALGGTCSSNQDCVSNNCPDGVCRPPGIGGPPVSPVAQVSQSNGQVTVSWTGTANGVWITDMSVSNIGGNPLWCGSCRNILTTRQTESVDSPNLSGNSITFGPNLSQAGFKIDHYPPNTGPARSNIGVYNLVNVQRYAIMVSNGAALSNNVEFTYAAPVCSESTCNANGQTCVNNQCVCTAASCNNHCGTSGGTCQGNTCNCITPPVCQKMSAPSNLLPTGEQTGTTVNLTWNAVSGNNGYALRIDDKTTNTRVKNEENLTTNSYQIALVAGHSYDWWIHTKPAGTCGIDYWSDPTHQTFNIATDASGIACVLQNVDCSIGNFIGKRVCDSFTKADGTCDPTKITSCFTDNSRIVRGCGISPEAAGVTCSVSPASNIAVGSNVTWTARYSPELDRLNTGVLWTSDLPKEQDPLKGSINRIATVPYTRPGTYQPTLYLTFAGTADTTTVGGTSAKTCQSITVGESTIKSTIAGPRTGQSGQKLCYTATATESSTNQVKQVDVFVTKNDGSQLRTDDCRGGTLDNNNSRCRIFSSGPNLTGQSYTSRENEVCWTPKNSGNYTVYSEALNNANPALRCSGRLDTLPADQVPCGNDANLKVDVSQTLATTKYRLSEDKTLLVQCPVNRYNLETGLYQPKQDDVVTAEQCPKLFDYDGPTIISNYQFKTPAKLPEARTLFVEFILNDGSIRSAQKTLNLVPADPIITNLSCKVDLSNKGMKVGMKGKNFGDRNVIKANGTNIAIANWSDTDITGTLANPPLDPTQGQNFTIEVTRGDGQKIENSCAIGVSQISLGAKVFCRAPSQLNVDNVDITLVEAASGARPVRKKLQIDQNGVIQGLTNLFQNGACYKLGIKAPKSIRKVVEFQAGDGTTVIPEFHLPVGDIYPGSGDGKINSNDRSEIIRQWSASVPSSGNTKTGDFNLDGLINSFDFSCMIFDFNAEDQPEPIAGPIKDPDLINQCQ